MNTLNFEKLKEHKQHGDSMLPIALYQVTHNSSPGIILPHHWHNELEFIYLAIGQAVFSIDDEAIPVHSGECVFVNSGQIHSGVTQSEQVLYYSIVFSHELLTNSFDSLRILFNKIITNKLEIFSHFKPEIPDQGEVISELKVIIHELTEKNTAYELALRSKLFSIFCTLARKNLYNPMPQTQKYSIRSKKYELLKNILGYISQNYNKKISLNDISKNVDLTPQYICRFFKEMTGYTLSDYINHYRIETSSTLLKVSSLSITDIALECGYENISYFNRVFKRHVGCTPTEFKINALN